jgi:hypothetical protein
VNRIQLSGQIVQPSTPIDLQLLVHEFLGCQPVFDPNKAIALLTVLHSHLVHLPGQPLSPVDPYLNAEGKPRLDARIHPAHFRMILILVDHLARAQAANHVRAPVLERRARFHRAQRTHQAARQLSFGR